MSNVLEIEHTVREAIKRGESDKVGLIRLDSPCQHIAFGAYKCNHRAHYKATDNHFYCEVHAIRVATLLLRDKND